MSQFDDEKNTPLHFAAAKGDLKEVTNLIEKNHKINPENFLGWTPLMMAARNGHFEVVKFLLGKSADATRENSYGMSTFSIAVASGNKELVRSLLQHLLCGGVSKQSMESRESPLSIAVLFRHQEILQYLLEQSFNINAVQPSTGLTPLMYAATQGVEDIYNLLISKGADYKMKNFCNQSAVDILRTKPNIIFAPENSTIPHQQPNQQHPRPQLLITPPNFLNIEHEQVRRSSNCESFYFSPNLTPVIPIYPNSKPHYFFPPDFSMPMASPQFMPQYYPNDLLNSCIPQSPSFIVMSPMGGPLPITPVFVPHTPTNF